MRQVEDVRSKMLYDYETVIRLDELNELKVKYLGKKGLNTELNSQIKNLDKEEKKEFGQAVNELRG